METFGALDPSWVVRLTALFVLWSICCLLALYSRALRAQGLSAVRIEVAHRALSQAKIYQFPVAQTRQVHRNGRGIV